MIWTAFTTGLFIGMFIGIFVMCLCRIAAEADRDQKEHEEYLKFHNSLTCRDGREHGGKAQNENNKS